MVVAEGDTKEGTVTTTEFAYSKAGGQPRELPSCFAVSPICDFLDQNKKSDPMSDRIKVRIILKWWRWRESNPRLPVFQLKLLHA